MKERPILFSAPMVRAILEGRKTQTRRVMKPQPYVDAQGNACWNGSNFGQDASGPHIQALASQLPSSKTGRVRCPFGKPGDRLWVREAFSGPHCMDASDGCKAVPPSKWGDCSRIWYWADGNPTEGDWTRPRPSIHMPRWASRILLEVTSVRVERLQDINEADAEAEGPPKHFNSSRDNFCALWQKINGDGSWDANPWVWVVEFKRSKGGA